MVAHKFKRSLLQAVSDWQRSSSPKRAAALKEECASLPMKFRSGAKRCYRQVALSKGFVWNLIAEDCLQEKVSSWTLSFKIAGEFKNGVPSEGSGFQGVIVMIERPPPTQVIVNIHRLYNDCEFRAAMEMNKASISGYDLGAGRYGGSQQEIVIEMDDVKKSQIRSLGGHSSGFEELRELAQQILGSEYGRLATPWESKYLKSRAGPAWLSQEATRRVLNRTEALVDYLQQVKQLQAQR